MACTKSIIKLLVFLFNIIILLASLALIILSIIYLVNIDNITSQLTDTYSGSPIFLLVVGVLIFAISFFGCYGAYNESRCLLLLYAIILLTFLVLQIAAGIYAFLAIDNTDDLRRIVSDRLHNMMDNINDVKNEEYFDNLQSFLECCGVDGFSDWNSHMIPLSCCPEDAPSCSVTNAYGVGCASSLVNFLEDSADVIGYVAIILCIIEFVPAVFALMLRSMQHY